MRKIIEGRVYDSDKAQLVGSWHNGESGINEIEETLCKSKSGRYFLHGSGGANTKYARNLDNDRWGGGEKIIPMSDEAAKEWAERFLTADEYAAEFEADPDEPRRVAIMLTAELDEKLSAKAKAWGVSKSELVRSMINDL